MPSTKAIRTKNPARAKQPARAKKTGKPRWWTSTAALTTAIVVAIGVALLIAAAQLSPAPEDVADASAQKAGRDADRAEAVRLGMPAPPATSHPRAPTSAARHDDPAPSPDEATVSEPAVTITGCLERDAEVFRLKDASGAAAPKARSWKSGFLRRRTPPIELVDSGNRLTPHVGETVSITGTLIDRTMTVRSLQRVAPSCQGSPKNTN